MKRGIMRRSVESFVVAKNNQTALVAPGTALNNSGTGVVNIANGQLGLFNSSTYVAISATPTVNDSPVVTIYQGTEYSANPAAAEKYPLWIRPYEATFPIDFRGNVEILQKSFRYGKHNTWVLGHPTNSNAAAINLKNDANYTVSIHYRSPMVEYFYSLEQAASLVVNYVAPSNIETEANGRNAIVYNLGYEINRNSYIFNSGSRFQGSDPVLAIAVGTAGTAISTLVVGAQLPVWVYKGQTRSVKVTKELLDSLTAASTASGFTHFRTINLANEFSDDANGLFIIGLDRVTAYRDENESLRTNLRVGLTRGFNVNTVRLLNAVAGDEGQGYGRQLDLFYRKTQGQRKYIQRHTEDPIVNFPSPVDVNENYTVFAIHHSRTFSTPPTSVDEQPLSEYVLVPALDDQAAANALIATLAGRFNALLNSAGLGSVQVV